jgi:hypothetical protein
MKRPTRKLDGAKLYDLRWNKNGLSQRALSEEITGNRESLRSSIQRAERGVPIREDIANEIAQTLHTTLDYLSDSKEQSSLGPLSKEGMLLLQGGLSRKALMQFMEEFRDFPHQASRNRPLPVAFGDKILDEAVRLAHHHDNDPATREALFHIIDTCIYFHAFVDTPQELREFIDSEQKPLAMMEQLALQSPTALMARFLERKGDCKKIMLQDNEAYEYLTKAYELSKSPYPAGRSLIVVSGRLLNSKEFIEIANQTLGDAENEMSRRGDPKHLFIHLMDAGVEGSVANYAKTADGHPRKLAEEYLDRMEGRAAKEWISSSPTEL